MDESPLTEVLMWSEPELAGGHYTARWEPGGELGPQWRQEGIQEGVVVDDGSETG